MKILFIGDMHLRISKFTLALQFLAWVNKFIEEQKPDLVVNLGDSTDTHAVIRSEILNELMNHVYYVLNLGIPYIYVAGNHDYFSPKDPKYHALLSFKDRIKDLYVVDMTEDLFGMTFVPYQVDGTNFPKHTQSICVAHQTFLGADYGAVNAEEGVDPNTVSADIIVSGHIHKKHVLGKVVYVGSPYAQDASDVNQIKGISVFDTDTFKFTFHRCPLPGWQSFKFEFGGGNDAEALHHSLMECLCGTKDHWILELMGPKAEVVSYIDSKDYQQLVKGLSIRLKTVFTDKQKQKVSISAISMEQILADYVGKVYSGSLDKDLVLSKARAVLDEVKLGDQNAR